MLLVHVILSRSRCRIASGESRNQPTGHSRLTTHDLAFVFRRDRVDPGVACFDNRVCIRIHICTRERDAIRPACACSRQITFRSGLHSAWSSSLGRDTRASSPNHVPTPHHATPTTMYWLAPVLDAFAPSCHGHPCLRLPLLFLPYSVVRALPNSVSRNKANPIPAVRHAASHQSRILASHSSTS